MTNDSNVEVLASFALVDDNDYELGIRTYLSAMSQAKYLREAVAPYLFRVAHAIWIEHDKEGAIALLEFDRVAAMQVAIADSPAMGSLRATLSLKGSQPYAVAYRKLCNGFRKELDMEVFDNCTKIAHQCAALEKAEEEADDKAAAEASYSRIGEKKAEEAGLEKGSAEAKAFVKDFVDNSLKGLQKNIDDSQRKANPNLDKEDVRAYLAVLSDLEWQMILGLSEWQMKGLDLGHKCDKYYQSKLEELSDKEGGELMAHANTEAIFVDSMKRVDEGLERSITKIKALLILAEDDDELALIKEA